MKLIPYDPGAIDWDEVRRARTQPMAVRFLDGARLFDYACRIAMDGIRNQFPSANDEEVRRILRERVDLGRRLDAAP